MGRRFKSMREHIGPPELRFRRFLNQLDSMGHRLKSMSSQFVRHFDPSNFRNCLLMVGN